MPSKAVVAVATVAASIFLLVAAVYSSSVFVAFAAKANPGITIPVCTYNKAKASAT